MNNYQKQYLSKTAALSNTSPKSGVITHARSVSQFTDRVLSKVQTLFWQSFFCAAYVIYLEVGCLVSKKTLIEKYCANSEGDKDFDDYLDHIGHISYEEFKHLQSLELMVKCQSQLINAKQTAENCEHLISGIHGLIKNSKH